MVRIVRLQRKSAAEDLPPEMSRAIYRLDRRCFPADDPPRCADIWWWVALDGSKVVGYAGLRSGPGKVWDLVRVGVASAYRGRGVGRRLLEARLAFARSRGKGGTLRTHVWANNPESLNNLVARGFRAYRNPGRKKDFVYLRRPIG